MPFSSSLPQDSAISLEEEHSDSTTKTFFLTPICETSVKPEHAIKAKSLTELEKVSPANDNVLSSLPLPLEGFTEDNVVSSASSSVNLHSSQEGNSYDHKSIRRDEIIVNRATKLMEEANSDHDNGMSALKIFEDKISKVYEFYCEIELFSSGDLVKIKLIGFLKQEQILYKHDVKLSKVLVRYIFRKATTKQIKLLCIALETAFDEGVDAINFQNYFYIRGGLEGIQNYAINTSAGSEYWRYAADFAHSAKFRYAILLKNERSSIEKNDVELTGKPTLEELHKIHINNLCRNFIQPKESILKPHVYPEVELLRTYEFEIAECTLAIKNFEIRIRRALQEQRYYKKRILDENLLVHRILLHGLQAEVAKIRISH